MKKINITFSFRDETGDYSVKVFPFVIKCIVSVIVVFNFIVIAMALPGEISDHVKYSVRNIINQGVRKSILTGSLTACMTI